LGPCRQVAIPAGMPVKTPGPHCKRASPRMGVIHIEIVAPFPHSDRFAVWLCTGADEERDALPAENPRLTEVRSVLVEAGFPEGKLSGLLTTSQSQETVDRDYRGSWIYALR
jgi:hypothetical protein